jgi:serine/threonine protein kinase
VATGTFGTWRRGHKIGSGSHGCVFKAQDTVTGQIFAVKMADIEIHTAEDKQFAERLEAELQICKDLRHPHIVRYLGHEYMDAKLCIKLEFVPGGSLLALLSEFGPLEGVMMQTASRGLVEGLNYLHTHNPPVVHRDIKGANVLVDTDFCVKLADFGCSKRSSDTQSFVTIGSVPWMAPEVINQKSGHGRKADIWSLGCTFIEMATAEKPWGADKFNNIMFALRHIGMSEETPPVPETLPPAGRDIVAQCVQRDPSDRMGAQELLEHEFIQGLPSTRPRSASV